MTDGAGADETTGEGAAGGHHHHDGADPRLQAGLDHLQRAAHEVIAASRALLDVAEELVDDPKAAAGVVDLLGSVAAFARHGGGRGRSHPDDHPDEDDGDPPVQRIPVS